METASGGNMKKSWMRRISMVGLVSGLLFGTVEQGQAEPKAQSGDVANGKTLFVRHCTGCHGPQGGGDGYKFINGPSPANLASPSINKKSDADLFKTLHEGKPNMPPWKSRLSQKQSRDVLAYVRTLAK
jgi:mono/diheme cytochrome c family protein